MKASQLIKILADQISKHGDVVVENAYFDPDNHDKNFSHHPFKEDSVYFSERTKWLYIK